MNTDDISKESGFESADEMFRLISSVDISNDEKMSAFKRWQSEDGTKDGLDKLME